MHVVILGFNHKSTSVDLREKISISENRLAEALKHVLSIQGVTECSILSTCNRTEIYTAVDIESKDRRSLKPGEIQDLKKSLLNFLSSFQKVDYSSLEKCCYMLSCDDAVRHAFRVSASLDSLVIGERQILGQFRDYYHLAQKHGSTGTLLNKLLQSAIALGKRARSETKIGMGAVSVSLAAVELSRELYEDLSRQSCAIFGAGEMADLAALHLRSKKVKSISFINRTLSKAKKLATKYEGLAFGINAENKEQILRENDIIFTATSAPDFIITKDEIKKSLKERRGGQLLLVDMAIPRDIEPAINDLDNVFLYCVDDLKVVVEKNIRMRMAEVKKVEKIIEEEYENFQKWYSKVNILPVITQIRGNFEKIREDSVKQFVQKEKKSGRKIENLDIIEKITSKITSKIIKELMTGIEKCETNRDWRDYSRKLIDIFGIDEKPSNG